MKDNDNQQILRQQMGLLGRPKIIVNADDFGYCQERSQGILELIKDQRISSLSVIVNAPNIQQQCCKLINLSPTNAYQRSDLSNENKSTQKLRMQKTYLNKKANPGVSVGLHLNLTQFEPCSKIKNYKNLSIIDSVGKFKGKKYMYDNLSQVFLENDVKIFIEVEIRAQIQKFIKIFKTKPSHIDGHNHVHIIPEVAEILCTVSRLFGIYKVRMPIPFQLKQITNEKSVNNMNKIFKSLAESSKIIYNRYGFLYPDYMLGLDMIGKHLNSNQIKTRIQQIMNKNSQNLSNKFIEIMVHPGYVQKNQFKNYETCIFSKSQQRQLQLLTLKSQQFSKIVGPLYSYLDIAKKIPQKSVLIYSKLTNCTGNLTTSLRLAKIMEQNMGFKAYLADVPDLEQGQDNQQDRIRNFIQKFSIKLIIGVNLTRSAEIIHKATQKILIGGLGYQIPYILMIAGTDANITLNQNQNQSNLTAIDESIKACECLISLSQDMKEKVQKYLQMKKINKQIVLINQSTISETIFIQQQTTITSNCSQFKQATQKPYIVFPTSFRKVKAVHHILSELNELIAKYDLNVFVLGPIISEQYYNSTINKFQSVTYSGCIPHSKYIKLMQNALFLINCSESQGMSCSILEGLASKVPIIARKNQGNCQLIQDGVNGFIYDDGQSFLQKAEKLIQNYEQIKKTICQKGYELIIKKFSYEKQIQKYRNIIQKYYKTKSYTLQLDQIQIQNEQDKEKKSFRISMQLVFLKNVHGVSPINLKIFDKFFQPNNNMSAFQSYIPPILEDQLNNSNISSVRLSILDIGCGSGIFALYFITKLILQYQSLIKKSSSKFSHQDCLIKLNVVLSDIQKQSLQSARINLRTLQQMVDSKGNKNIILESVILIESSMFEEIHRELPDYKFDIILANMPQTMFKNAQSRIDKNGGPDGFKHTQILLKDYSKFVKSKSTSLLITLFSYMLEQKKYQQLLQLNQSKIEWRSQTEIHKINCQDYDKMEGGLAAVIQQQMKKGKANISKVGDIFYVPAQLRVIMQK